MILADVYFIIRAGIGFVCLWAAAGKIGTLRDFQRSVGTYGLLPSALVPAASFAVVVSELIFGSLIITGWAEPLGAIGALCLFVVFAAAIGINLLRNNRVPCHCFGSNTTELISIEGFTRAVLLAAVSAIAISLGLQGLPTPSWRALVPALTIAVAFALLVRMSALIPQTWSSLRTRPVTSPTRTRRVSFKHMPLDQRLRILHPNGDTLHAALSDELKSFPRGWN